MARQVPEVEGATQVVTEIRFIQYGYVIRK
jgi:hypothetical protein